MEQHSSHFRQTHRSARQAAGESRLEREKYRAYLTLSFVFVFIQAAVLVYSLVQSGPVWNNLAALVITVFFTYLTYSRRLPLDRSTVISGYLCAVWITGLTLAVLTGAVPFDPAMMLINALAALIALSWLPIRHGVVATIILSGVLAVTVLYRAPEALGMLLWTLYLNGLLGFFNLYGRRINDERLRSEMLEHLAFHDPLTGTLNRRGGWTQLEAMMAGEPEAGGIMLVDIDRFKRINDRLGHAVGDQVLVAVARALEGEARQRVVARWGGEEFLIVLPELSREEMQEVAREVLSLTGALQLPEVGGVPVSIGLARRAESENADRLLALADQRMYAAKQQGGNQWLPTSW